MQSQKITRVGIALLFSSMAWIASCAVNPVSGQHELMLLSESDEIRLGRQTDREIEKTYGVYNEPDLDAYIQAMGQDIAAHSHRSNLHFTFKVLDSPVVNAFAVPGGYVYLTRGILSYFNSEAELAGVIGHEIGHIAARHSAQQLSKAQLAQLGLGIGSALSQTFRQVAGVAQFGVGVLFLKYSRDNERQADELGVEYASKAGFDAAQMASFFKTLERLRPTAGRSGLPSWLSTHPDPPDRISAVQNKSNQWATQLGRRDLQVNAERYLRQIDGLVFGEDPRQGYVAQDVFYHPRLRFQLPLPKDWKVKNTPTEVKVISPKENAAILLSLVSGSSLQAVAQQFAASPNARVLGRDDKPVNGLPARQVVTDITTGQGAVRVLSYFIQKDILVYVLHAVSAQPAFGGFASTFERCMNGFADLTDPERIGVEPERIRIRAAKTPGTLEENLRVLGVAENRLEETALLNGRRLHETIAKNTLLKVVE
jgi:predicted Zn-dependent protease